MLKSTKDQRGNITDYDYDVLGRLSSITDPPPKSGVARSVTSYEYTVDSLLESVTDPLGRMTTFSYDEGGRRSRVTEPDPDGAGSATASYTDFTYDSLGNLLTQSDALGHTTSYTLDSSFQTLSSTDPNSATTTFTYDSFGQVASVVDPLSNSTLYTYNNVGQVVTEDKPVSTTSLKRTYSYDGLGNMRSLMDRNGRTTTSTDDDRTTEWSYDRRNRVSTETWKTGATVDRTFTYVYDTLDRTISLTDSDSLATDFEFAYDDRGQLQAERQVTGLVGTSVVLDREFDGDGNRTYLATNFGGTLSGTGVAGGIRDSVVNYYYDAMNRVWVVVQSTASQGSSSGVNTVAPKTALFQFNAASQVTDVRRYNATTNSSANLKVHSRYAYDGAGRLTSITHGKSEIASGEVWDGTSTLPASLGSTNMLAGYFLSYDAANRVTSFASQRDAFQTTYSYDAMDQLTSATSAAISGMTPPFTLPGSETYNLDANGNRKSSGGASQSASQTQNRLQTDGTYNYTYDNEGNVTSRTEIATGEVTDYTWDHRNRLVSVTEKTSATGTVTKQTEFVYDAFDQRVAKRVDSDGNGSWDKYEAFVWADGHEILRLVDSDGDGTSQPFRVANRYFYADAVDQLISDEQYTNNTGPEVGATSGSATAGTTLWALADHLGSVRDVVDNNGVVRQHVVFNSFGNRLLEVDYDTSGNQIANTNAAAIDELFGYTGRDWDIDVGLQYNRARWYDPGTGRWMSLDPIGFAAGDANLYRYARNSVINTRDPSGLVPPEGGEPFADPEDRERRLAKERQRPRTPKSLDDQVGPIYIVRAILGIFVIPQVVTRTDQHVSMCDDGRIENDSLLVRKAFLIDYALAQGIEADGKWHGVQIKWWTNSFDYTKERFVVSSNGLGSAGFFLSSPHTFDARGQYVIQILPGDKNGTVRALVKNVYVKWRLTDRVDANNRCQYDWGANSWGQGVLETTVGDLIGDKLLGGSYDIEIHFLQSREEETPIGRVPNKR